MNLLRRILPCLLAVLAGPVAAAAGAEAPRLAWQVSPDRIGLHLEWHDPTGIRAVLESSANYVEWSAGSGIYDPARTSFVFHPVIYRGQPTPWGFGTWPVEPVRVFRVRRLHIPREGRVMFGNRILSLGINAPVTFLGDPRPGSPLGGESLAGPRFLAQLLVIVPGVYVGAVGQPVPFRTGTLAGSIAAQVVTVPMDGREDEIQVAMGAWLADLAPTYFEALARGLGYVGQSEYLVIRPSTYLEPVPPPPGTPPPPAMVGLRPFDIPPPIGGGPP